MEEKPPMQQIHITTASVNIPTILKFEFGYDRSSTKLTSADEES
jgi:hypothetical protein